MEKDLFQNHKLNVECVQEAIEKLDALDLDLIDLHDLKKMLVDSFKLIPYHKHYLPKGQKIFRARVNDQYSKFQGKTVITNNFNDFNNVSQLTNRNPTEILEFGRANIPGMSSFYSSTNLKLACAEVIQDAKFSFAPDKEILVVTVGEWIAKKPITLAPLLYSEEVKTVRKDINSYVNQNRKYMESKYPSQSVQIHDLIMKFFSDQFSKKNISSHNDYKISALYSKILEDINASQSDIQYDGIIYPSVVANFLGTNISLFDNNLDSKIELTKAHKVLCANIDFAETPKFGVAAISESDAIDESGNITWKTVFKTI